MPENDQLTVLDSTQAKDSLSVAKARHLVRTYMLQEALEALHMIGMNPDEKTADRNTALIFLAKFAEGEGGDDMKFATKLTAKEAQLIARIGTNGNTNRRQKALPQPSPGREVGGKVQRDGEASEAQAGGAGAPQADGGGLPGSKS